MGRFTRGAISGIAGLALMGGFVLDHSRYQMHESMSALEERLAKEDMYSNYTSLTSLAKETHDVVGRRNFYYDLWSEDINAFRERLVNKIADGERGRSYEKEHFRDYLLKELKSFQQDTRNQPIEPHWMMGIASLFFVCAAWPRNDI